MHILRIEHPVRSFEEWKKVFDSDPVERQKSGVRSYRISRPVDDTNFVTVDLDFDSAEQAEALLANLREAWKNVEGKVVINPNTRIVEVVEMKNLQAPA